MSGHKHTTQARVGKFTVTVREGRTDRGSSSVTLKLNAGESEWLFEREPSQVGDSIKGPSVADKLVEIIKRQLTDRGMELQDGTRGDAQKGAPKEVLTMDYVPPDHNNGVMIDASQGTYEKHGGFTAADIAAEIDTILHAIAHQIGEPPTAKRTEDVINEAYNEINGPHTLGSLSNALPDLRHKELQYEKLQAALVAKLPKKYFTEEERSQLAKSIAEKLAADQELKAVAVEIVGSTEEKTFDSPLRLAIINPVTTAVTKAIAGRPQQENPKEIPSHEVVTYLVGELTDAVMADQEMIGHLSAGVRTQVGRISSGGNRGGGAGFSGF